MHSLKIIVLGSSNVGKTQVINRFVENRYNSYYYATLCKKLFLFFKL